MAANSTGRALSSGGFGKRFINQIWTSGGAAVASPASRRRAVHASSYDKNVEEHVRPAVVPDDVIDAKSDKYWGPHPSTGVFGPAGEDSGSGAAPSGRKEAAGAAGATSSSVLEQTAWFRPLEDVEKPPPA